MNKYTAGLKRIEFAVTFACTGKCRHCSEGEHFSVGQHIGAKAAADAVRGAAQCRSISSCMTFGGEPMLFPDTVYAVHSAARDMDIPKRQLITNGFFSKSSRDIENAAEQLCLCGVNDILLSADAFHQETIPLEPVTEFSLQIRRRGISLRLNPAWLVSREHDNPYNRRASEIISRFEDMGIKSSEGNIIFPSGNALRYLSEYFVEETEYTNPYEEDPEDIRSVCIEPDGSVLNGNIYKSGIAEILEGYSP